MGLFQHKDLLPLDKWNVEQKIRENILMPVEKKMAFIQNVKSSWI